MSGIIAMVYHTKGDPVAKTSPKQTVEWYEDTERIQVIGQAQRMTSKQYNYVFVLSPSGTLYRHYLAAVTWSPNERASVERAVLKAYAETIFKEYEIEVCPSCFGPSLVGHMTQVVSSLKFNKEEAERLAAAEKEAAEEEALAKEQAAKELAEVVVDEGKEEAVAKKPSTRSTATKKKTTPRKKSTATRKRGGTSSRKTPRKKPANSSSSKPT